MVPRLPRLCAGGQSWRLPLSPPGAAGLIEMLLTDDPPQRTSLAARLLADEPSLALWVCCRGFLARRPANLSELAAWLAEHTPAALDWSEEDAAEAPAEAPDQVADWAGLAEASVFRARAAASVAESLRDSQAAAARSKTDAGGRNAARDEAGMLALLSYALDWLRSSGPPVSWTDCRAGRSCLPAWLVEFLAESKGKRPAPLVQLLADASAQPLAEGEPADIRTRWLDGRQGDSLAAALPALAGKLARLQRLQSQFDKQLEQEKLASLYWIAYGASHEINNPLANISNRAESLLAGETDTDRQQSLAKIIGQAYRAHEMINDLMLFAKPPEMALEEVQAGRLLREAIDEIASEASAQGTQLRSQVADGCCLMQADPDQLVVALKALLKNSLEALGAGGRIEVSGRRLETSAEPSETFEIMVRDTGPGISPEVRRHLFDPFYSGREANRGLGLGLSKCWRIVTLHGGQIDVLENGHQGACFRIALPIR